METTVVGTRVTRNFKRRLVELAEQQGFVLPGGRPNMSMAVRRVMEAGLQAMTQQGSGKGNGNEH